MGLFSVCEVVVVSGIVETLQKGSSLSDLSVWSLHLLL